MSQQNSEHIETLFSFELLVESVRLEKDSKVSAELALGVRLLDFPTLLISQPPRSSGGHQQGEYVFNRGKSCSFKMNVNSLHGQLRYSPLHAMVLDVKEDIPKLVGTSLVSLAAAMDRIKLDVAERGASAPSSHGERKLVGVSNLKGEKIGFISMSYKLLSLGVSLLPHIRDSKGDVTSVHGKQEGSTETKTSPDLLPLECGDVCSPPLEIPQIKSNGDKQERGVCSAVQTEQKSNRPQTFPKTENKFEDDSTIFCPPRLYYSNTAEERGTNKQWAYSEAFAFDDTYSDEETSDDKFSESSQIMNQSHGGVTSRDQQAGGATPNVLGDALQQLPLLNALLVELSQLNNQNPRRPLSIHPNLAWIYRPASIEASDGPGNTSQKAQTTSLQRAGQPASLPLKHLHSPRDCSTPVNRTASVTVKDKQEQTVTEEKRSSTPLRKKLVYGTTKTFNLRLKQISPRGVKRRECAELKMSETQSSTAKGTLKSSTKSMKSAKGKSALKQSPGLPENIETVIQSITVNSAQQETITLKQKNQHEKDSKQDGCSRRNSDKPLPSVDADSVAQKGDRNEHHSDADWSQSESDRHGDKIESSGNSRRSAKSSFSDSSGEGQEEADYADDFNSLEPSDAYSPDPASSPEPSRAKIPSSPPLRALCNSDSEGFQRGAVLPVPIKATSSPQRTLRATHIIRPRTHTSALSFSSDDGDRESPASSQTIGSRRQIGSVERSSGADSSVSSRSQSSASTKNSDPVQGFSTESMVSIEPQEEEELEDELGTLDFRYEYQHISKLVANKLPGYTM